MAKVKIQGHASGTGVLTVTAPNTSTDRTITLPDATGTLATTADVPSSITDNGDATAITIDSSENVLIGKTTTALATAGLTLGESGFASITRDGYEPLNVNRLSSDGNVISVYKDSVVKGSIAVTGSGIGIQLGGTDAAHTLDDYEEGTFSPSFGGSDSQGFTIGSTQSAIGKYVKVGSVVHFHLSINITGSTPTSQGLRISGFPFTNNSTTYAFFPIGGAYKPGNSTSLWAGSLWRMDKDGTVCRFYVIDTNVTADGNQAWGGSNDEYRHEFSGSYLVTI
jgi:hypothetical protein